MTPRLVIFDCDGVLVDSEPVTNRLLRDDLATRGLDMPLEQVVDLFVGGTMRAVGQEAARMGANMPVDWVDGFYAKMYAALALGTPLINGVPGMLDRLDAAGIPYAVGSNGSREKMGITLGQHPAIWARLKDRLYSAQEIGAAKPAPDLYLKIAADHDTDPAECIVIDDSASGVRAGIAAGMPTLGFAEHGQGPRLARLGAKIVNSMDEAADAMGLPVVIAPSSL